MAKLDNKKKSKPEDKLELAQAVARQSEKIAERYQAVGQFFGRRKIRVALRQIDRVILRGDARHTADDRIGKSRNAVAEFRHRHNSPDTYFSIIVLYQIHAANTSKAPLCALLQRKFTKSY